MIEEKYHYLYSVGNSNVFGNGANYQYKIYKQDFSSGIVKDFDGVFSSKKSLDEIFEGDWINVKIEDKFDLEKTFLGKFKPFKED